MELRPLFYMRGAPGIARVFWQIGGPGSGALHYALKTRWLILSQDAARDRPTLQDAA